MNVTFFPRNDYPDNVEVCTHRLGKSMTYTEQTDSQQNTGSYLSYQWFMPLAKERNIKVGCFLLLNSSVSTAGGLKTDYENGKIWLDAYSLAPNINSKIVNHETITQEEWNAAYNTYILPNFQNFTGKKPIALSYSYSVDNFKDYITQFLGGRNSVPSGNYDSNTFPTSYGVGYGNPSTVPYSFATYKSKGSTMRWYDAANSTGHSFATELQIVSDVIDAAKLNHGWVTNFTHWHNYVQNEQQQYGEDYLNLLALKNANNDIYFAGYGEALAYLVYRQSIKRVVMYTPIQHPDCLVVRIETNKTLVETDGYLLNEDLMQIPISVKFSTIGTPLQGYSIKSNRNLIDLGGGDYIVEIPFEKFPFAVIKKQIL